MSQLPAPSNETQPSERLAYKPEELSALLGIGRSSVYEALRTGAIRSTRLGRRIVVSKQAIDEFLANQ
jgi:excisionase family DNA binding protein